MAVTGSAVVGTGFIGPVHVEALRRLGEKVIGILGSTPDKSRAAASALNLERAYQDYDDLLADKNVSVVHLTSPNRYHYEQCKKALAAGKHIICEKPLAMTSAETGELVALADKAKVVAAVCYNVRFYPLCLEVRQRIAEGQLGDVYHVTGSYVQDWLFHQTDFNWRVLAQEGGTLRAVADIGTHWMDLIQSMTGQKIAKVCADLQTMIPIRHRPTGSVATFQSGGDSETETQEINIDTEDYGSVLFRLKNGGSGCFTVSQVMAGRKNCLRFEIAGSKGSLAWNSEQPNELWLGHRDKTNEILVRDPSLMNPAYRIFANYPGGHNEGFPDTFKQLFRAVYGYIESGERHHPQPFPTFAEGHQEVCLCEAILKSHRERSWAPVQ